MHTDALPTVYLDADACPVKDLIFRAVERCAVPLIVVANTTIRTPAHASDIVRMVVVPGSPDAADDWIAERATAGDLVITADIPLAARVIESGATAIDFRGGTFSPSRIGDALAARDLNAYLRSMGMPTSGPPAYSKQDRSRFASTLDAAVTALARRAAAPPRKDPA